MGLDSRLARCVLASGQPGQPDSPAAPQARSPWARPLAASHRPRQPARRPLIAPRARHSGRAPPSGRRHWPAAAGRRDAAGRGPESRRNTAATPEGDPGEVSVRPGRAGWAAWVPAATPVPGAPGGGRLPAALRFRRGAGETGAGSDPALNSPCPGGPRSSPRHLCAARPSRLRPLPPAGGPASPLPGGPSSR